MEEIYLSAKDVANHIDSKIRTIENWAAAGNIQQNEAGKYGLVSALKYQLEKNKIDLARNKLKLGEAEQRLEEAEEALGKETKFARERKLIAEANKEEALARIKKLEADRLEGQLVVASEVLELFKNKIAHVRAKLIGIPAKVALEISGLEKPDDVQARLTVVIDEALIELGSDD